MHIHDVQMQCRTQHHEHQRLIYTPKCWDWTTKESYFDSNPPKETPETIYTPKMLGLDRKKNHILILPCTVLFLWWLPETHSSIPSIHDSHSLPVIWTTGSTQVSKFTMMTEEQPASSMVPFSTIWSDSDTWLLWWAWLCVTCINIHTLNAWKFIKTKKEANFE